MQYGFETLQEAGGLPGPVLELPGSDLLKFRLVLMAEFAIAWLGLLRPRLAWPILLLTLVVFDALLGLQIARGETSCGCFGSAFTPSPAVMLAIDSAFLLLLLGVRPWSLPPGRAVHGGVVLLAIAVSGAVPWIALEAATAPPPPAAEGEEPETTARRVFAENFYPEEWVDQYVWDTSLAQWLPEDRLPVEGLVIFYRRTCDVCAEHLVQVAQEDDATRPITLIRIVDEHDNDENNVVHVLPQGGHVTALELPRGVIYPVTTPADLELSEGVVVRAREGITPGVH